MSRSLACGLAVVAASTLTARAAEPDPLAALAVDTRPLPARWQTDYRGALELGIALVSDDSSQFGQYNGLQQRGANLLGNLQWQAFPAENGYWQVALSDLGLDTREGAITWGLVDRLKITAGFDSQQQVRNNSGRTPFSGNSRLNLPNTWTSGLTTADFDQLETTLRDFKRELDRDRLYLELEARLDDHWRTRARMSYEEKRGNGDIGGAIYIDAAAADAVLLPLPVDQETLEFAVGAAYEGSRVFVDSELSYTEFDNQHDLLTWQNPYSAYGEAVAYPHGEGGLSLAPDNQHLSGRVTASWVLAPGTRVQMDGSYARASQNQDYAAYSVNPAIPVTEALPRESFDAEVDTATVNARLLLRPLPRLNATLAYALRDRSYGAPRDGYLYPRGDADAQPDARFTVYNSSHDLTEQTASLEAEYRLPDNSRLGVEYAYQVTERRNAAVEETQEDRYTLSYRLRPWGSVNTRLKFLFADRAASTYHWDQDYLALLDRELINATPDTQRFNNHPQLFQYFLANRERSEATASVAATPAPDWTLNVSLRWRDDRYDQSELGLTDSTWSRAHGSVSYAAGSDLTFTAYAGVDQFEYAQDGRAFNGGQEKNPFAVSPPLPQASDPTQNWSLESTDHSVTAGATVAWQVAPDVGLEIDYHLVTTEARQSFISRPDSQLSPSDLPDVETRMHQVHASGLWHIRENLSWRLSYRFYHYNSDDWAIENVGVTTMDKVLSFGAENPHENIHYLGASVIYRWQ